MDISSFSRAVAGRVHMNPGSQAGAKSGVASMVLMSQGYHESVSSMRSYDLNSSQDSHENQQPWRKQLKVLKEQLGLTLQQPSRSRKSSSQDSRS